MNLFLNSLNLLLFILLSHFNSFKADIKDKTNQINFEKSILLKDTENNIIYKITILSDKTNEILPLGVKVPLYTDTYNYQWISEEWLYDNLRKESSSTQEMLEKYDKKIQEVYYKWDDLDANDIREQIGEILLQIAKLVQIRSDDISKPQVLAQLILIYQRLNIDCDYSLIAQEAQANPQKVNEILLRSLLEFVILSCQHCPNLIVTMSIDLYIHTWNTNPRVIPLVESFKPLSHYTYARLEQFPFKELCQSTLSLYDKDGSKKELYMIMNNSFVYNKANQALTASQDYFYSEDYERSKIAITSFMLNREFQNYNFRVKLEKLPIKSSSVFELIAIYDYTTISDFKIK